MTVAPGLPPRATHHKTRERDELLAEYTLNTVGAVDEGLLGISFQAMAVTLKSKGRDQGEHADRQLHDIQP